MLAARSTAAAARAASTRSAPPCVSAVRLLSGSVEPKKSLVTGEEGVHQTMKVSKAWRNKPLFRRQGDVRFKTGLEAANLLVAEAKRRDAHETNFIANVESTMSCLGPVSSSDAVERIRTREHLACSAVSVVEEGMSYWCIICNNTWRRSFRVALCARIMEHIQNIFGCALQFFPLTNLYMPYLRTNELNREPLGRHFRTRSPNGSLDRSLSATPATPSWPSSSWNLSASSSFVWLGSTTSVRLG